MKIRTKVVNFAKTMEKKLRKNDHKGGWRECTFDYLFSSLKVETEELSAFIQKDLLNSTPNTYKEIREKCADIANFAMMISDNCSRILKQQN